MPNKVEKYGLFCWNKIYHHIWPSVRPGDVMLCGEVPELPRKPRDDGSFPWMTKLGVGSYSSQRTVHTSLLSSPPSFSFFTTTLADFTYNYLVFFCCIWSNFATVRVWSWVGQWFSNLCLTEDWIWPPTSHPPTLPALTLRPAADQLFSNNTTLAKVASTSFLHLPIWTNLKMRVWEIPFHIPTKSAACESLEKEDDWQS